MTDAEVFMAFLCTMMDRKKLTLKQLSQLSGVPYSTIGNWRRTGPVIPKLRNGLMVLDALGSIHAAPLLEIWRSWKDANIDYIDELRRQSWAWKDKDDLD